ncbi:probable disease resistance protein At1g12290 [Gossypium hirsutum]|uniref:Probable disease resistance protein At1g12290 n=1 Tax=Gossypium hirsutum TaxID=3635 RepID=A0A1U8PR17_GOSHI|nr:probable disease resistance protein At1g12290 [Gossypium hirsutum]
MHNVIRDMTLWIAGESEKEKFFVKSGVQLKELPKAEKWEEVITDDFFNSMPMLRVLDLSDNVNLKELPVGIAKLVSLEHLNLSVTGIRKLPVELKTLAKLKYLNLEGTDDLEMIPQQLISNFSKLQVLKMEGCGYGCLLVLEEVEHLKHLNVLTITFRSASELEKASRFNKFFSCAIEVVSLEDFRDSRSLTIMALAKLQHLCTLTLSRCWDLEEVKIERNIIEGAGCFHSLRTIILDECNHLRDVSWVTFAPHLKVLLILECEGLEEIISEEKLGEVAELKGNSNLFSKLENLHLSGSPKLKTIYQHALPFPQLKEIYIKRCPMLKKLPLNSNSAKGQRLVIKGREEWWKDVEWEDESTKIAFLPSFRPV